MDQPASRSRIPTTPSQLPADLAGRADEIVAALAQAGIPEAVIAPAADSADLHSLNNHIRLLRDPDTGRSYVLRLPSPDTAEALGVVRTDERLLLLAAAAAGVTPPVLAYTESGLLISPFLPERPNLGLRLKSEPMLSAVPGLLRRLQQVTDLPDGVQDTYQRLRLMIHAAVSCKAGLPGETRLLSRLAEIEQERAADRRYPRCLTHHDVWANNLLDDGARLWLLDFEFAGIGDGWFDLASISQQAGLDDPARSRFLRLAGRRGDAADLAALAQAEWLIALFEACWATIMAAHRFQAGTLRDSFDYAGHAERMLGRL